MCRTTRIAILVAACAALAIAPAAAVGKKLKFQGPLNQPFIPSPNGFATDMPSIELKVKFDGKKPTAVVKVRVRGVYGPCDASNGCTPVCLTATGICEPPICRSSADLDQFKVKKGGRFAVTRKDLVNGSDDVFTVTGRATKRGASGTVRVVSPREASSSHAAYTCDTGAVSWTATK
jgi:hypothetical protein